MIFLDIGDHRPLYEQIYDRIKEMIIGGILRENDKILSVREMACNLAINPNTIQKAYKELENDGYIYSQMGKGYFVAPRGQTAQATNKESLYSSLERIVRELKFLNVNEEEIKKIISDIYREEKEDV